MSSELYVRMCVSVVASWQLRRDRERRSARTIDFWEEGLGFVRLVLYTSLRRGSDGNLVGLRDQIGSEVVDMDSAAAASASY